MRLFDAVSALKPQKHEKTTVSRMTTIWSQQIDPGSVLPEYPQAAVSPGKLDLP